jgi:hypothetical protein
MAGTGKSTISRTVAQFFANKGQLGASFFFKSGEGDRGNATRFFTTIISQLVLKVPALIPYVNKAIDADPTIFEMTLKDQFQMLILRPLSEIKHVPERISKLVIVIDALDECERGGDIRTILHLLPQTQHVRSVYLRFFVASRPELPIRLGLKDMPEGTYQELVLHEIPQSIIEHEISTFLKHELAEIRHASNGFLPPDWPGERNIQALVNMATPLFSYAATVCRFVGDPRRDPEKQLNTVLKYWTTSQASGVDRIYLQILEQLFVDLTDSEKEGLAREFRKIVGSIVILAEPLSTLSLARLLSSSKRTADRILNRLHSVLSVPTGQDSPVRLLHHSFRDFLLAEKTREESSLWVDESETHRMIATKCLERMSGPEGLRENMCNLETPGKLRTKVDSRTINGCLPADIQYACRYWAYHLEQSKSRIRDQDQVHGFLQKHFLHWLEALSLIGKISESIALIDILQTLFEVSELLI